MAEPGLGFGAFGAVVRSAELLAWIIKKTQEVRRLKKTCREIQQHAEMLQAVLQDNEAVLKDLKMKMKLDEILREVATFVLHCIQDTNLVQRAWEVLWECRLQQLMDDLKNLIIYFTMESSVGVLRVSVNKMGADVVQSNVLSGQATLIAGQRQLIDAADRTSGALAKLTDDTNEDKRIREEQSKQISEILMEMKRKDVSVHEGPAKIDFREGDPRLNLSRDDTSILAGSFQGQSVICLPVSTSQIDSRQGPRFVSIYSKISANTLVHPFYGIAEREGRL
jgi:hypothetical protein